MKESIERLVYNSLREAPRTYKEIAAAANVRELDVLLALAKLAVKGVIRSCGKKDGLKVYCVRESG